MIRKYKGKPLTVPLAASVIAFGLALSGCDETATTNTTSATHIVAPKGTVMGHVQDTNGNPIAGATVNLGGQSKKTDASGQYVFTNVAVTGVAGTDAGGTASNLVIVITPPAASGYLGGTVTVNPLANIEGQQGGGEGEERDTTTGSLLVSGFSIQAGAAVLPMMGAQVSGVLRDNQTNLPVANTVLTLDLVAVQTAGTAGVNNTAIGSTIRAPLMQVTTGADGSFLFPSVPADSRMRLAAVGYTINAVQTPGAGAFGVDQFGTNDEDRLQVVGDVMATKTISADTAAPVIRNIVGSVLVAGGPHNLSHDGSTISLQFSEPVTYTQGATIATGDVLVYDTVARAYVAGTAALSADGLTLTFTADAASVPAPGSLVNFNLNRAAFADAAGNWLNVLAPDTLANVSGKIGVLDGVEDGLGTLVGAGNGFVQTQVLTYRNPAIAGGPVMTQQAGTAATGDKATLGIGADVDAAVANIQQLNARDDDDVSGTADSIERINALLAASGLGGANLDVAQGATATLVTFPAIAGAVAYNVSMTRSGGALAVNGTQVTVVTPAGGTNPAPTVYRFLAPAGSTVSVVLNSVLAGDSLVIAAEDSLGNQVPGVLAALVDNVAPIPTLQSGYGVVAGPNQVLVTGASTVGNGAELVVVNAGGTLVGPVFPVSPGLLADPTLAPGAGSALDAAAFGFADIVGTTLGVTTTLLTQGAFNGAVPGGYIYAPTRAVSTTAGDLTIEQWLSQARTMGVSFSEDVVLTGTPSFTGGTALSGWAVANDVITDIMGAGINEDLVYFSASVNGLQGDHNDVLNFAGALTDTAGNAAPATSVIMRDYLPPFITSATITDATPNDGLVDVGSVTITLTFNEAVAPDSQLGAGTPIILRGVGGAVVETLVPSTTAPGQTYLISSDRKTMIFTKPANAFTAGTEWANYGAPNQINIFSVEFSTIPDAVAYSGAYTNTWANTGWSVPHAGATYRQ